MRRARLSLLLCLLAWFAAPGHPTAQSPAPLATFRGGMPNGIVRDVAKVGSVLYAVGTWVNTAAGGRIDTVLWTIDGTNAAVQTVLPDSTTAGLSLAGGEAITPDAAYIASQARSSTGPTAVRVTRGTPSTNLNLTPSPAFTNANNPKRALGLSDDGSVVYGTANTLAVAGSARALRFTISGGVATATGLFTQPTLDVDGFTINQGMPARGVSSNGNVAVGFTFTNRPSVDTRGWRYVNTAGVGSVTLFPLLTGGTWNQPFALSNDGNLTLLGGNSAAYPNGEVALYNSTTNTMTPLGAPNSAWSFSGIGGISDDGSVVAVSQQELCVSPCTPNRDGYIHNSHGWFPLPRVLADAGVDLTGWRALRIFGMSGDATRLWGSAEHNGAQEGFVVEFSPNYLSAYNVVATAPADTSIVGVWAIGDDFPLDTAHPGGVLAFLADGTYFDIEPDGFERGYYSFSGGVLRVVTLVDTNGSSGLSGDNGTSTLSISGDEVRAPANCVPGTDECGFATRITGIPGTLTGGWVSGDPTQPDSSAIVVFTSGGDYFMAQDGPASDLSGRDGIEIGTVTWSLLNGTFSLQSVTIGTDTNGEWGLSHPIGTITAALTPNELGMLAGDASGSQPFARIIDPATVAQVTGGSADGVIGAPFSYQVTAQRAQGYGATGLPDGLAIDSGTGLVSGTPTVTGFFPVSVFATNAYGDPRTATVNITIASVVVTSTGTGVSVTPEVPADTPPVTMTFDTVTTGGTTTVAALDATVAPPPPSGFQVGSVPLYYEIETTAAFTGEVTICFSYAGVDFGGNTPRLFHYVNGQWVDITSSVDAATQTLCGTTTSFSPFAIFTSPTPFTTGTGFYAPVSPLAGFVNAAKAGSTVPLKFNVSVNGSEKTDTTGLDFAVTAVACSLAPEDPVDYATQENTSLRYDTTSHQFILNWKTPKATGCYIARVTNADGLLLSATFRLK